MFIAYKFSHQTLNTHICSEPSYLLCDALDQFGEATEAEAQCHPVPAAV